jgi:uncharacterized membrane protein HdeD (DUF308 family)
VIVVREPAGSLTFIALAIGVCLLLAGVTELAAAIAASERRAWSVVLGLIDIAIGVVVVSWPQFGVASLAVVIGISLIARGIAETLLAAVTIVALRERRKERAKFSRPSTARPARSI